MGEVYNALYTAAYSLTCCCAQSFVVVHELVPTCIGCDTCHHSGLWVLGNSRYYLTAGIGNCTTATP